MLILKKIRISGSQDEKHFLVHMQFQAGQALVIHVPQSEMHNLETSVIAAMQYFRQNFWKNGESDEN